MHARRDRKLSIRSLSPARAQAGAQGRNPREEKDQLFANDVFLASINGKTILGEILIVALRFLSVLHWMGSRKLTKCNTMIKL